MLVFKARPRRDPAQRAEITESQKRIMRTVMSAMDKVRAQVVSDEGKLIDLIAHSPIDKVINAVTVEPWLEMQPIIEAELLGEFNDAGRRVKLPKIQKATLSYSFDAARPEAAAWAATEAGKLVVEVVESQRKVIRSMISDDTAGAKPPASIARDLRDVVGLTLEQSGWVRNHREREVARLIGENKTFDQAVSLADKSTERYQKRIHRYRTETIARTETLRASNEGRNEAWRQGVEEGFINPGASKQWSAELDGRVCEECAPLDGEVVKLNEEFSMGDPPVHPNCRCTVLLVDEIPADIASMTEEELDAEIESLLAGGAATENITDEEFPLKSFAEIEGMSEEIWQHYNDNADKSGDQMLYKMYEAQGYNKTPSIVTISEMDALQKAGDHHIVYRGVDGKNFTDQYKYGEHFAGKGIYGNGSYNSTDFFRGRSYSTGPVLEGEESNVMKIAIPKSAKIIDYEVAAEQQYKEWKDRFFGDSTLAETQVFADVGRWATAKGYDAIQVRGGTQDIPTNEDYFIVLNRGNVVVQDKNVIGNGG